MAAAQADPPTLELTDEDVLDAMQHISGYLDISTEDFRALYRLAQAHANERLFSQVRAGALMRTGVEPLRPEMSAREAAQALLQQNLKSLPVVNGGSQVIGILTETNLLRCLGAALAVSTAIALMHLTRTLHPPGGATALIAVIGSEQVHALGYLFVLIPATLGPLLMLLVALLINNLNTTRRYPEFWF